MQQGGYPTGAELESDAPWKQPILNPIDVDVDVVMTISKRVTISVDDYMITDGEIDLSDSDLYRHLKNQVTLPTEAEGVEGWNIEDFYIDSSYVE